MKEYCVLGHRVRLSSDQEAEESNASIAAQAVNYIEKLSETMGIEDYKQSDKVLLMALKIAGEKIQEKQKFLNVVKELEQSVDQALDVVQQVVGEGTTVHTRSDDHMDTPTLSFSNSEDQLSTHSF